MRSWAAGFFEGEGSIRDTCIHGHSLTDPANARLKPNGWRRCLACEKRRKGKS